MRNLRSGEVGGNVAIELDATMPYLLNFASHVPETSPDSLSFYATFTSSPSFYVGPPRQWAPQRRNLWKEWRFFPFGVAEAAGWSNFPSMRRLFWFALFVAAVAGPYLWSNPQVVSAGKARALALVRQLTEVRDGSESRVAGGPYEGFVTGDPSASFGPVAPVDSDVSQVNQLGTGNAEEPNPFVSTFKPVDPLAGLPPAVDGESRAALEREGPRLAGPAIDNFDALFRFEVGPEWVTDHWSRVSTVRSEEGWQGLRVPVVTGMAPDDLAGSLTYYFDSWRRLQRIAFRGTTGDARRVIAWSASHGLRREPTIAAELFTRRRNGRATSVLAIERPAVISSQLPNQRQDVLLELSPPDSRVDVSREMQAWLRLNRPSR